ncbi:MAG: ATP phosphoribosyltransferase [Gammaproteobacteria bacterium]
MITFAVSKGRILEQTLPLLAQAGIRALESPETSRKLILPTNHADVRLLVLRATDVPVFLSQGAADIGVVGKDVLLEQTGSDLYEVLDLQIARCKLMVAEPDDKPPVHGRLRVATKYVNTTRNYFAEKGQQVDIIKLYGSMELAPLVGLSHKIVDVVDTGKTLIANGLQPTELIMEITSRLVVNKSSMKRRNQRLRSVIQDLAEQVKAMGG